jgi:dTDP-4-amino-4,6-dideoxygalactose transaminase
LKLRHLEAENDRRREIAGRYAAKLVAAPISLPSVPAGCVHAYHQYVVATTGRDELAAFLAARGIATQISYPRPVHLQPAYQGRVEIGHGGLPRSERICGEILSLPMHPFLADAQIARVTDAVLEWCESRHG